MRGNWANVPGGSTSNLGHPAASLAPSTSQRIVPGCVGQSGRTPGYRFGSRITDSRYIHFVPFGLGEPGRVWAKATSAKAVKAVNEDLQ